MQRNVTTQEPAGNERVRLLEFLTVFAIGGTERQVVNLVRRLDRSRFDLSMACFRREGQFLQEVVSSGVPVAAYPIRTLYHPSTVVQQLKLARFLRRKRIQVLHTYGFYATTFALPAAKLAGVPATVISIRDMGEMLSNSRQRVQRLSCRMADSILVNAEAIRQWLIGQGCRPDKIQVIRNGIAPPQLPRGQEPIRRRLHLPATGPLVGMLSRLNRMKGVEYLLQAAAALAARFPDAHFVIVGDSLDPNYRHELERDAVELGLEGRITFTGFRLDVAELLAEMSVSVLPSLSEGLSNTLLESMAAGVPVVAANVGGNVELIEDGTSGILVPPADAEALARGIALLLENRELARRLGEAGRRRIRQNFSMEAMVQKTEQHYLHLLGERVEAAA